MAATDRARAAPDGVWRSTATALAPTARQASPPARTSPITPTRAPATSGTAVIKAIASSHGPHRCSGARSDASGFLIRYGLDMSAPDLSACSPTRPALPSLPLKAGRATIAVFDEGDHLEVYLAPVGLRLVVAALAGDGPVTAWDQLGAPLVSKSKGVMSALSLPDAGEAIDGAPRATIPASLRAGPRSLLAGGHEWVVCAEDGVHAAIFARRPSVAVRAVHGLVTHLLSTTSPSPRIDPVVVGHLARPSRLGPHVMELDADAGRLTIQSPTVTRWLEPDRRGIWRIRR